MSAVAAIASFSRSLVRRDQMRLGGCAEKAIKRVAERIKVSHGTFANIFRQKVKSICVSVGNRIISAAISDIEQERKQLEHEQQCLMAVGVHADPAALAEIEEGFEIVDRALAKLRGQR